MECALNKYTLLLLLFRYYILENRKVNIRKEKTLAEGCCIAFLLKNLTNCVNPILTGGGVKLTPPPPCTKSETASRPLLIATQLFMTFFFQVLRIF